MNFPLSMYFWVRYFVYTFFIIDSSHKWYIRVDLKTQINVNDEYLFISHVTRTILFIDVIKYTRILKKHGIWLLVNIRLKHNFYLNYSRNATEYIACYLSNECSVPSQVAVIKLSISMFVGFCVCFRLVSLLFRCFPLINVKLMWFRVWFVIRLCFRLIDLWLLNSSILLLPLFTLSSI